MNGSSAALMGLGSSVESGYELKLDVSPFPLLMQLVVLNNYFFKGDQRTDHSLYINYFF